MREKGDQMTDEELASFIDQETSAALGGDSESNRLSRQRAKAMDYYLGEPFGGETTDNSQVVTREVMDTIEWLKPELMKLFASGTETVRFEPQNPDDVEQAQQATDYINYLFHRKNEGFKILYQWITDGLLQKNGIVKVWWDTEESKVREEYEGLTQMELEMLLAPDNVELLEQEEVEGDVIPMSPPMDPMSPPQGPMGATGPSGMPQLGSPEGMAPPAPPQPPVVPQEPQEEQREPSTYDVAISRTGAQSGLKIIVVPPEEFIISRKATCINDSPFCAHKTRMSISDLNALGYDNTEDLPESETASGIQWTDENRARFKYDDTDREYNESVSMDPTMREVWVTEAYIRVDHDQDGIAELRKVVKVGNRVLANEEVDAMPFASWTPIIMSHKFYGLSEADLVMDLQRIQSQLFRNLLDNQYLTNNGRYTAIEGMVNLDDLLSSRPHGVVRQKMAGAVARLDTPQLGQTAFEMLGYVEKMREKRTGVSERTQGLDPNALGPNTAATAVNQVMTASQQRIELIARVFGETGLTDLFKLMYKEVLQNQTAKQIFRLRDKYVEVNPSEWRDQYDTSVVVGLGNGSRESELMQLGQVIQLQQQLGGNPATAQLATPMNVYQAVEDLVVISNKASGGRYFTDPSTPEAQQAAQQAQQQQMEQMQQQQQMAEMQLQLEQTRVQIEQMKAQSDAQRKSDQTALDTAAQELDELEHEDEVALKTAELEMEFQLEQEQGRGVALG